MLKFFRNSLLLSLFTLSAVCGAAEPFYRGMTLGAVSSSDISDLAVLGPNIVSYRLSWYKTADNATVEEYDAWLDSALAALDELLPTFAEHNIKVIIALYTPPGGFASYSSPALQRIFAEEPFQRALVSTWQKIAQHYAGNTNIYAYDLVNEPAQRSVASGLKTWTALALELVTTIRALDTQTKIMVQPIYGNSARLSKLRSLLPFGVVYDVHFYYPHAFQHQGLYGFPLGVSYPKKKLNKRALRKGLQTVIRFQRKNKAEIFIGEFSVVRWAPGNSAFYYMRDLIDIFEQKKWGWTYHAWREADAWSVEHGSSISDHEKVTTPTNRQVLLQSYFVKNTP